TISAGNPVISFNTDVKEVKTVDVTFEGGSREYLIGMAFKRFFVDGMTAECRQAVMDPENVFIGQALRVEGMSFVFKDQNNGKINLSDDLGKIAKITSGVEWSLTDEYTLTIKTPKYIGYQMARVVQATDGSGSYKVEYSNKVDGKGEWIFDDKAKVTD